MIYDRLFSTRAEAKLAVFESIEVWYNRQRKHAALGISNTKSVRRSFIKQQTLCLKNLSNKLLQFQV